MVVISLVSSANSSAQLAMAVTPERTARLEMRICSGVETMCLVDCLREARASFVAVPAGPASVCEVGAKFPLPMEGAVVFPYT